MENNNLNGLSSSDLKELADLVTNTSNEETEQDEIIYQDPQPNEMGDNEETQTGIVVPEEKPQQDGITINGLDPETLGNISEYVKDMDKNIEERREKMAEAGYDIEKIESGEMTALESYETLKNTSFTFENVGEPATAVFNLDPQPESENDMTDDEFNRKYEEAVVVIDKTNFGKVINFTDEERAKLEKAKKIKLEEVETISLSSLKTKKIKTKKDLNKVLKRTASIHTSNIVLPLSGYTATMRGCSSFELISLLDSTDNIVENTRTKWSLIHSKIEDTSIGKMDFNEFLHRTASSDYQVLIYGILCATYPDDDKIEIKCDNKKCGKTIEHHYSIRSLIRAESMSEKLKETFMNIVDNSYVLETAKEVHKNSQINTTKTVELPESKIIIELKVQSAYDLINRSLKSLVENKDPKYNQASVYATAIHRAYVIDPESDINDPEYFEVTDTFDITQLIYQLGTKDLLILRNLGDKMFDGMLMDFGLMDVTCPSCRKHRQTVPIDLESILFTRYQQEMNAKVE